MHKYHIWPNYWTPHNCTTYWSTLPVFHLQYTPKHKIMLHFNRKSFLSLGPNSLFMSHEEIITHPRSWKASRGHICSNLLVEYPQNSCSERLYLSNRCQWHGIWIKQKRRRDEALLAASMQMQNLNYIPAAQRIFGKEKWFWLKVNGCQFLTHTHTHKVTQIHSRSLLTAPGVSFTKHIWVSVLHRCI